VIFTVRVAVAVSPALSVTVKDSVCEPLEYCHVFHEYNAVLPVTVCVETVLPSILSVNFKGAVPPDDAMRTVVVSVTVAPSAGDVNEAVSDAGGGGGVEVPLPTFTGRVAVAVWPFIVTASVSVCAPPGVLVLSHVYQSVLPVAIVCDVRTVPPTDSVKVFD
jgi:hypothetical protein